MKRYLGIAVSLVLLIMVAGCSSLGGMVKGMVEAGPVEETKVVEEEAAPQVFSSADIVLSANEKVVFDKGIYQGDFFPDAANATIDGAGSTIEGHVYIWADGITFTNLIIDGNINVEYNNCTFGEGVIVKGNMMIQGTGTDYSEAQIEGEVLEK